MAHVVFFEKPGCGGNARQKALLRASGHEVEARSLLAESWTAENLRPFFGDKPVRDWFNPASPRVKSGEIARDALNELEALTLMIADPVLIRRPLMRVAERSECGFDQKLVSDWIGLKSDSAKVSDVCIKELARKGD